ncbi:MAG TPA: SDR family NAD(P)-dependent oxidoreductase, partial [Candidatus Marinimicrobia bacterium]|nr:SDR family NAD(P)-dependent oxidoreductase [Candidatus Neomarinimicrobiota bacterium]
MSYYSGKNILISGAASGIGKLMAMEMGKLGGNMLLLDIDALGLESLKNEMAEKNIHSKFFICDLSNRQNIYTTAQQIGEVDILVNNA